MAMRDESEAPSLSSAAAGLDDALKRLESAVRQAADRLSGLTELEHQADRLRQERAELAGALDRMTARAERLDHAADQVSHRLVGAMEKVRSALNREEV